MKTSEKGFGWKPITSKIIDQLEQAVEQVEYEIAKLRLSQRPTAECLDTPMDV